MSIQLIIAVSISLIMGISGYAQATCSGSVFNPVSDVAWNSLFPIRVGGVALATNSSLPDGSQGTVNPVCSCTSSDETYMGINVGFWDIVNLAEVVDDAWCSPTLGTAFSSADNGFHGGANSQATPTPHTFKQVHWLSFPALKLLNLLTDMSCLQGGDFDFVDFSELMPDWNEDLLAALKDPKVFLLANSVANIACAGSNALAQVPGAFLPTTFDSFWWCWWDNIYPLSGNSASPSVLTTTAQLVGKQIFEYSELGLIQDYVSDPDGCTANPAYVAKKSQWRFQFAKPIKSSSPMWVGQSEFVWGSGKTQPYAGKNFLLVVFQKKNCCQKLFGTGN
jgi:conjugal transfer pilus assembly protein TraU